MRFCKALAFLAGLFFCASSFAGEGALAVKMKNEDEMAVMVVSQSGSMKFDSENDFMVIGQNGEAVVPIYPFEIFEDRFWSEPLPEEVFKKISEGMAVRPVTLGKEPHWEIRYRGAEFLLYRKKKRVAELRLLLETLLDRTNVIRDNLQSYSAEIARDAEKADEMKTANKLRSEVASLIDDRDGINRKINDLLPRTEKNQKKIDRLSEELTDMETKLAEKRGEIEKEEYRAGISTQKMFDSMRNAASTLQEASAEIQALSTELYNALSQLEYIEQNIQKPSQKP
ncbi:hypothetical protein EPN96_10305 [bacterium]|nr:MAG: hypothetical protein EPN96_10305 [bacterium]